MLALLAFLAVATAWGQSGDEAPRVSFGQASAAPDQTLTFERAVSVPSLLMFYTRPAVPRVLTFERPAPSIPKVLTWEAPQAPQPRVLTWDAAQLPETTSAEIPPPSFPPPFPEASSNEEKFTPTEVVKLREPTPLTRPRPVAAPPRPPGPPDARLVRSRWVMHTSTPMTFWTAPAPLPTTSPLPDPYARKAGRQETWIRPVSVLPTTPPSVILLD